MTKAKVFSKSLSSNNDLFEGSDDDEEQLNMEAFLHRKDIKGNWSATGPNNKKFILALSSSQMIICAPCSDQKWAKIKARRYLELIVTTKELILGHCQRLQE